MGCPLPKSELIVISQSGLSVPRPTELIDVGSKSKADAKIGGITPGTLIFKGKCEASPEKILFPTCLFGYCTMTFL